LANSWLATPRRWDPETFLRMGTRAMLDAAASRRPCRRGRIKQDLANWCARGLSQSDRFSCSAAAYAGPHGDQQVNAGCDLAIPLGEPAGDTHLGRASHGLVENQAVLLRPAGGEGCRHERQDQHEGNAEGDGRERGPRVDTALATCEEAHASRAFAFLLVQLACGVIDTRPGSTGIAEQLGPMAGPADDHHRYR